MLLNIQRFWVDNILIYLKFWWHNPGWKTINCIENVFQLFYFFSQQFFIWFKT